MSRPADPTTSGGAPTAARREGDTPRRICAHEEVVRIARDPERYSNAVSRFLQLPNGLDGAEHARFRALIDRYFTREAVAEFEPACRKLAQELVASLPRDHAFDAVADLGAPFAVRAQSAWLGWPAEIERQLLEWLATRQEAMRSGDRARSESVAQTFDAIVRSLIEPRPAEGSARDVTGRLVHDRSLGRPLEVEEIVSILRNWTGGDLGTMALAVGVVIHALATRPGVAGALRGETSDEAFDLSIEECLRLDDPFVASRRVATRESVVAGIPVAAGDRLALDWAAANRDPAAFVRPEDFDPVTHAAANIVYGTGPHVCPGRPLARLEMRELVRALLAASPGIALAGEPIRENPPLGGYRAVPVRLVAPDPWPEVSKK